MKMRIRFWVDLRIDLHGEATDRRRAGGPGGRAAGATAGRFIRMEEAQPVRWAREAIEEAGCCSRAAAASPLRAAREADALREQGVVSHVEHPRLNVEAGTPIVSADERRVRRRLSARITTPGGSEPVEAEVASCALPPPDDSASAQNWCFDRARR